MLSLFSFLKPKEAGPKVAPADVEKTYRQLRFLSLAGVFLGYMAYYLVRNNFKLSTPYLKKFLALSNTEVGLLVSTLLIAYGVSKGVMSSISDKCSPKAFMALGLVLCAAVNVAMGFSTEFWMFAGLVALLGAFQGMGVGPCFITIANWYPRKERGFIGAVWNVSHNVGGGLVAPLVASGFAALTFFGLSEKTAWQLPSYLLPAVVSLMFAVLILALVKGSPTQEGLPTVNEIVKDDVVCAATQQKANAKPPEDLTAWGIFYNYVLFNKHAWYVSMVDAFVYMIRFGTLAWLPIYLLTVKGFTKEQMAIAFLAFEWAAIPSTLFVGYLTDKFFKGYRMPPAIICMVLILFCIVGYWQSASLYWVTLFAAGIGCLIYVPQFLASVQTMEIVPPFAVGSAVGLRGFMSYIVGASFGTTMFGFMVDRVGWSGGFYVLLAAAVGCIIFCILAHYGVKELAQERAHAASIQQTAACKPPVDAE